LKRNKPNYLKIIYIENIKEFIKKIGGARYRNNIQNSVVSLCVRNRHLENERFKVYHYITEQEVPKNKSNKIHTKKGSDNSWKVHNALV
jgi:hypothetical protein